MLHVQCLGCNTSAYTENNADPDSALVCPDDADCRGDDKPVNSAGRHPVTITVMPGSLVMHRAGV